jgi:hypothetical protein
VIGVVILAAHVQLAVDDRQVAAGNGAHFGMLGQHVLLELLLEDVAEDARRRRELGRRELLVADHEHRVLDPGVVERTPRLVVERLRQVDTGDFGAEVRRQRLQVEFHDPEKEVWRDARPRLFHHAGPVRQSCLFTRP